MPRYIIDFAPEEGPVQRIDAEFPDREAARMFMLHYATACLERREGFVGETRSSTMIRDEDGKLLDSVYSIVDHPPE